ncbi:MAG: metalloregulator ArsR/SmtB family transcription factor [Actinobacteria bacterium]|nr:metalloregulator ArsR/SmtB family transcription factor [Actinomycetota bacterium]
MKDSKLNKIIKVIKALSDESRIRIVNLLKTKDEICVCELTEIINLSQPTISSHLKKLYEAEIIDFKKEGLWVNYYLNKEMDNEIETLVNLLSKYIKEDFIIKQDFLKISSLDRFTICKK